MKTNAYLTHIGIKNNIRKFYKMLNISLEVQQRTLFSKPMTTYRILKNLEVLNCVQSGLVFNRD